MNNHITKIRKEDIKIRNNKIFFSSSLMTLLQWSNNSCIEIKIFANLIIFQKIDRISCSICGKELRNKILDFKLCDDCKETLIKNGFLEVKTVHPIPPTVYPLPPYPVKKLLISLPSYVYIINSTLLLPNYISELLLLSYTPYLKFFKVNNSLFIGS